MTSTISILELALWGQALLWLAVALIFMMSRQASLYHPLTVYLLFHAMVFVVRPLTVHYLNFDREWSYMGFEPSESQFIRPLMASSLALMVFATATITVGWCRLEFRTATTEPFSIQQKRALLILTILLAPVIAYSLHAMFGGAFTYENRGGTYVIASGSGGGYGLEAQYMAGPLVCAWLAVTRFRWYTLLVLAPYLYVRTYAGGSRWTIVLVLIAIGLVFSWQKRLTRPPVWAVVCAIPLFLLFHAIGQNRQFLSDLISGAGVRETVEVGATGVDKLKEKYDSPDFANFDYLAFVTSMVPERTGTYTYGAQYVQLFTEPIPRKLWPGKPVGSPIRLFNLNNYGDFFGLTPSLVGDGWMSGGWIGITVTMTLVGTILGILHRWFWKHSDNNMVALFYLVALAMLPQWYRDGGISIAKFLFWNLSPLIMWMGLTWLMGSRMVPAYSVWLPRNTRLLLVPAVPPRGSQVRADDFPGRNG
jgi:hypothetical protein